MIQDNYQKLVELNEIAKRLQPEKAPLLIETYGTDTIVNYAKEHFSWTNLETLIKDQEQAVTAKRIFEICCFLEINK